MKRKSPLAAPTPEVRVDSVDLLKTANAEFLRFYWRDLWPRDRVRILSDAPRTLWLFGAGASHHYDLNSRSVSIPLANGFFQAFHALHAFDTLKAHVGPLISYLNEYRNVPPNAVSGWTEKIETFMTSLEKDLGLIKARRKHSAQDASKGFSLATALNNMTFILGSVINEAQNGPSVSLYKYLLDFCGPNDVFVTFNWDTLLDRALTATGGWSPNAGYGLKFHAVLDGVWKEKIGEGVQYETIGNF